MEIKKQERNGRSRDTGPAIFARRMKKWRRWAEEMRDNGWTVQEPEQAK